MTVYYRTLFSHLRALTFYLLFLSCACNWTIKYACSVATVPVYDVVLLSKEFSFFLSNQLCKDSSAVRSGAVGKS